MKASETFRVEVQIHTVENQTKYIIYTNYSPVNGVLVSGKIWYGLGSSSIDGSWHTYARDVSYDLKRFYSDLTMEDIGYFRFIGSGSLDDIQTYQEDTVPPVIIMLGDNPMDLNINDTFIDPGVEIDDNRDPNPTQEIDSNVDTGIVGTHQVTYTAIDVNGNSATVVRSVVVTDPNAPETSYEDAEDGNILGWSIRGNEDGGATISNIVDSEQGSRVIEFDGSSLENSFRLQTELFDGSFEYWNDRIHTHLSWDMKYAEPYEIDIRATTLLGTKHIIYQDSPTDNIWHSFEKDISSDIREGQPENELISIDYFEIRGNGRVDNIIARGEKNYTPLNKIGYIKRSSEDAVNLGDLEAMRYITPDNEFAIVDDDRHLLYGLSLDTNRTVWIMHDSDFGTYTQEYPNGYEPLNTTCQRINGQFVGFCDPEAIAYDPEAEIIYIFTGNHPGELTTFKLTRSAPDQNFSISDWKRMGQEHSAAIVIDGQLYATDGGAIKRFDWDTGETEGDAVFTAAYEIQDMAYDSANGKLWILIAPEMLYRINWATMQIEDSYDMTIYDIWDPRGVEVVGNKLYIGDGYDDRTDDLKHAIHIFDLLE
jgi:hypothetical protein